MKKVTVAIPTCKRPGMLLKALKAVSNQKVDRNLLVVEVLVADNDALGMEGVKLVESIKFDFSFPIHCILVTDRGISNSRNALIKHAIDSGAEFLAFMDDDQVPDPEWLTELLDMQADTGADVVASAVFPLFEGKTNKWMETCSTYSRDTTTNGLVSIVHATCGVLLNLGEISRKLEQPWFDKYFGLIGGGDSDFFLRLKDNGGLFARASRSKIYETYPESRMTFQWALKRSYRIGNTDVLRSIKSIGYRHSFLKEMPKIIASPFATVVLLALGIGNQGKQVDAICKISRALGKLAAFKGRGYNEYTTIHGS